MARSVNGWNHNTHYHPVLLAAVPRPCGRALDVGCGLGGFARTLAGVAQHVDALERDPATTAKAREMSRLNPNITFIQQDFLSWQTDERYNFISMIATLHFLPLDEALHKAASLLDSGGVLGVIGLHRDRTPIHAAVRSAMAMPVEGYYRLTREIADVGAPIREPAVTLSDIRRRAASVLPGAQIQRRLLWRYTLIWTKVTASR